MANGRAADDEQPLYESAYVLITRTRAVVHGVTYKMSDLSSARVYHQPLQMSGVVPGIILFVIGLLSALSGSRQLGAIGMFNGALVLTYFLFLKYRFYVQITTAAGQIFAPLVYRKKAQARGVVRALTRAMSTVRERRRPSG